MVSTDLSKLSGQIEVERALVAAGLAVDSGVGLDGNDDTQTVSANSDEKAIIYSVEDGEPHEVLKIDARRFLLKRKAGRPVFWIPELGGSAPHRRGRGDVRCYLDPEFDEADQMDGIDRAWIDSVGLQGRTCNMMAPEKNNQRFASVFDRDDHMAKKHRREWATIQARLARQREERRNAADQQTRDAMMAMAQAAVQNNTPAPAPVSTKAAKPAAE